MQFPETQATGRTEFAAVSSDLGAFLRYLASGALLSATYFVTGKLAFLLPSAHPAAAVVSPGHGIALAAALLLGRRVWPAIFIGAFVLTVTTTGAFVPSLAIAVVDTLEPLAVAYLINRLADGPRAFDRARNVLKFTALAALLGPAVTATAWAIALSLAGLNPSGPYGLIWGAWLLGNAVGVLVITPVIVLWKANPRVEWTKMQALEAGLIAISLLVVGEIVFGPWLQTGARHYPLSYVCVPSLVWAAFRFGPRETATSLLLLSLIAIWSTLRGLGPFAGDTPAENVLLLQVFLAATAVLGLVFGAVVAGRKRAEEERERLVHHLRDALDHVKVLRGLLPICAACKRIRNNQGSWEAIETYVSQRSEADFTHSICSDCAERLYPDLTKLGA